MYVSPLNGIEIPIPSTVKDEGVSRCIRVLHFKCIR